MGQAKRMLEEQQERNSAATRIAIEAGVLKRCPYHDIVFDVLNGDNTPAYKLGNHQFSEGRLDGMFESRRQMTDAIDEAVTEAGMECSQCNKD